MIIRPEGLEIVEVDLEFNFSKFTKLEIDLSHINKDDRSKFSKDDVAKIVIAMLSGIQLSPSDEKEFGDDICSYFVRTASFKDKKYKLVF